MKISKLVLLLSGLLVLSISGNLLFYFKPTAFDVISKKIIKEKPVFEISNIYMKMSKQYDFGVINGGVVRLDFEVKNISNSTQILFAENISLFDFKDNNYQLSDKYHLVGSGDTFTQLSVAERITPGTVMKISSVFEVPAGEFYCLGCSDNIKMEEEQTFIDEIRNAVCKFSNFGGMLVARKKYLSGNATKMGRAGHPSEDCGVEVNDSANE